MPRRSSSIPERSLFSPRSSALILSIARATRAGGGPSGSAPKRLRRRARVCAGPCSGSWTPRIPWASQTTPQRPIAVSKSAKPASAISVERITALSGRTWRKLPPRGGWARCGSPPGLERELRREALEPDGREHAPALDRAGAREQRRSARADRGHQEEPDPLDLPDVEPGQQRQRDRAGRRRGELGDRARLAAALAQRDERGGRGRHAAGEAEGREVSERREGERLEGAPARPHQLAVQLQRAPEADREIEAGREAHGRVTGERGRSRARERSGGACSRQRPAPEGAQRGEREDRCDDGDREREERRQIGESAREPAPAPRGAARAERRETGRQRAEQRDREDRVHRHEAEELE